MSESESYNPESERRTFFSERARERMKEFKISIEEIIRMQSFSLTMNEQKNTEIKFIFSVLLI